MTDFAVPNSKPGECAKCHGSGEFRWGGHTENGVWRGKTGTCWSCKGTGEQTEGDIRRNETYNRHKIVSIY